MSQPSSANTPINITLNDHERGLIRRTWTIVEQAGLPETAVDIFYGRLFEEHPDYRSLFPHDMSGQIKKLAQTLGFAVRVSGWKLEDWQKHSIDLDKIEDEDLFMVVRAMGKRHFERYRVQDEMYGPVGQALIYALESGLGELFTEEVEVAWTKLYALLAGSMILGAHMRTRAEMKGERLERIRQRELRAGGAALQAEEGALN